MFDIFLISSKTQTFQRAIPPSRLTPCRLPCVKRGIGLAPNLRKSDFFDSLRPPRGHFALRLCAKTTTARSIAAKAHASTIQRFFPISPVLPASAAHAASTALANGRQ